MQRRGREDENEGVRGGMRGVLAVVCERGYSMLYGMMHERMGEMGYYMCERLCSSIAVVTCSQRRRLPARATVWRSPLGRLAPAPTRSPASPPPPPNQCGDLL